MAADLLRNAAAPAALVTTDLACEPHVDEVSPPALFVSAPPAVTQPPTNAARGAKGGGGRAGQGGRGGGNGGGHLANAVIEKPIVKNPRVREQEF